MISGLIGHGQGKRAAQLAIKHTLMLETLLIGAEKVGAVELNRDEHGRITGGRNVTIKITGMAMKLAGGSVTVGAGEPQAGG